MALKCSEFHNGNFSIHKSGRFFSALDQPHEQNNAVINGDGVPLACQNTLQQYDGGWSRIGYSVSCV